MGSLANTDRIQSSQVVSIGSLGVLNSKPEMSEMFFLEMVISELLNDDFLSQDVDCFIQS